MLILKIFLVLKLVKIELISYFFKGKHLILDIVVRFRFFRINIFRNISNELEKKHHSVTSHLIFCFGLIRSEVSYTRGFWLIWFNIFHEFNFVFWDVISIFKAVIIWLAIEIQNTNIITLSLLIHRNTKFLCKFILNLPQLISILVNPIAAITYKMTLIEKLTINILSVYSI